MVEDGPPVTLMHIVWLSMAIELELRNPANQARVSGISEVGKYLR